MFSYESKLKTKKFYNHFFLPSFWIILFLWLFCFIGLITILFYQPHNAVDVREGQHLYFGFYTIIVGTPNTGKMAWTGMAIGMLIILTTILICVNYWVFRNTRYGVYIEKFQLTFLYIFMIVSLILLFLINVFNRPLIEFENLDLINQGWNVTPELGTYSVNFNYVYDLHVLTTDTGLTFINLQNGSYMSLWVCLILIFFIIILCTLVVLFYNSCIYLSWRRPLEY